MTARTVPLLVALLVFLVAAGPLAPTTAQSDSPLVVIGDHHITVFRGTMDGDTTVLERIYLSSTESYDGEVWLDLHPQARRLTHNFENPDGSPRGLSGQISSTPLANSTVGGHQRHVVDLAARDVTIDTDDTVILRITYIIPNGVDDFTRGFTLDTPRLATFVGLVPGLVPTSDETPLVPQGTEWGFTLAPAATGPFAPGDRFAFTWEQTAVPMVPLSVHLAAAGNDPMILTATASGGIPPYTYTWDLSGDGVCDDAEGPTAEFDVSPRGTHTATVCVTDGANPPGEIRQSYETRTELAEGTWDGPSPLLLLLFGLLVGALLLFGLTRSGLVAGGAPRDGGGRGESVGFGAESRDLLETRQRVMVAGLKELEIARKKGEVSDGVYTPLKAELKKDTVRVMRELEKRKDETV